jgi:hypothetical protein
VRPCVGVPVCWLPLVLGSSVWIQLGHLGGLKASEIKNAGSTVLYWRLCHSAVTLRACHRHHTQSASSSQSEVMRKNEERIYPNDVRCNWMPDMRMFVFNMRGST